MCWHLHLRRATAVAALVGTSAREILDMAQPRPVSRSEVNNGGHFQYFVNQASFSHRDVVATLREPGATHSAIVLKAALRQLDGHLPLFPDAAEVFETERQEFDLGAFDAQWGSEGDKEIQAAMRRHLKAHESEFVEWVP